ncbi:MAG: class I SAM-dependent methyltransferase [Acidimicrobiales bacterium]
MTGPEDHTGANRATYDRIAKLYFQRQPPRRPDEGSWFGALERGFVASLAVGGVVADLGCGPALDGYRFSRLGFRVVGMDLSAGMLATAAERHPGRLAQADLRALPVADHLVDAIWCAASLLHVPEEHTTLVLQEFGRALRPAGVLALMTALGDVAAFGPVPYAPEEVRWFVYRRREVLLQQLRGAGSSVTLEDQVATNRVWFAVLARRL